MPGIYPLVQAISNDVVGALAAAGYPALADGAIMFGPSRRAENAAPPRIVMWPIGATYGPKQVANRSNVQPSIGITASVLTTTVTQPGQYASAPTVVFSGGGGSGAAATAIMGGSGLAAIKMTNGGQGYTSTPTVSFTGGSPTVNGTAVAILGPTTEQLAQVQRRTLHTEWQEFGVHCWGTNTAAGALAPDLNLDFDGTQALAQQVIASTHLLIAGFYRLGKGRWMSADPSNTQVDMLGQGYAFTLEIATPVLDALLPIPGAGAGTQPGLTIFLQPSDGSAKEQAFP